MEKRREGSVRERDESEGGGGGGLYYTQAYGLRERERENLQLYYTQG